MQVELFVPGRLCLFGEHSDWAGKYRTMNADIEPGAAIVTGIEQGIAAVAEKSDRFEMKNEADEISDIWQDFGCRMQADELKEVAKSGSFFSYCAGVASYVLEWYNVGGVKITLKEMTLPMKSGLSSSAAICVLVARAFNLLYGLNLNTQGEMNIAYLGELRTASRCGRLDQACAFGIKPILMNFDGEEISIGQIKVKEPLYWVFADLCAKKDTIKILRELNKAYPFPSTEMEKIEQEALGSKNRQIVNKAIGYMAEGNALKLGELMTEAQRIFDSQVAPLCPEELNAPKLHRYLNNPTIKKLTYGGKGVGSQGDGSIQFIAKDKACQKELVDFLREEGLRPYPLTIQPRHTIRKAIIPVAGFGTRLYPETKLVKKDFFPIVDKDGLVKPVILILLEELLASGIEDICIVLGNERERQIYKDFFETRLDDEHFDKLNDKCKQYESRLLAIGKHLHYAYQTEKKGFGHAVFQAEEFAGNEPILLLLGDTLYRSNTNKPCCLQFIEEYENIGKPMVSIHEIPLGEVSHYGIVSGEWSDSKQNTMNMNKFVEKPTAAYAEEFLGVPNRNGEDKYYAVFGQYILTPDIFEQLRKDVESEKGEIELTSALETVRKEKGMVAVRLDGEMFDIGIPSAFKKTVTGF